ncbi:hypothetical protein [Nostoc sp.]|uniref:hypothetical protein n=1 Tax=Nostoc sp. TaxID=1180 RepID=UPI002FF64F9D
MRKTRLRLDIYFDEFTSLVEIAYISPKCFYNFSLSSGDILIKIRIAIASVCTTPNVRLWHNFSVL